MTEKYTQSALYVTRQKEGNDMSDLFYVKKNPKLIDADVLDKIKAEIIQIPTISSNANDIYKADVLTIIDKYKAESEDKE